MDGRLDGAHRSEPTAVRARILEPGQPARSGAARRFSSRFRAGGGHGAARAGHVSAAFDPAATGCQPDYGKVICASVPRRNHSRMIREVNTACAKSGQDRIASAAIATNGGKDERIKAISRHTRSR